MVGVRKFGSIKRNLKKAREKHYFSKINDQKVVRKIIHHFWRVPRYFHFRSH